MRKNYAKLMATGMFILAFMAGCSPNSNAINDGANEMVSEVADDSGYYEGEQEKQNDKKPEENKTSLLHSLDDVSSEDIEKELAAYRAEREKGESSLGNYTLAKLPSEENYKYGIGSAGSYTSRFDARELNLAFKAASDYVKGTLNLESEAYICEDPRMTAIYEDKDKGVADGYDADDIFLCEYDNHGKWQYLILVREGKGSAWKVLYHGSSYKTDESDGGDKK